MEYFARFWIESIHSYVGPDPQIVLVGTHKDELKGNDRLWKEYFEKVRCLFDGTDLIYHIQKEDFAVDNYDISDPGIADLLSFILKKHTELVQPVEIPARWIQLEKALRALKTSIITFQDVVELDKKNTHPLLDEEQLKLFLHYHHEKGTLFFYDEGVISDFVCLDPQFLIDAFKCIITSEQFYKNDPDIRSLWKVLSKEGRLTRQLIDKVWINQPDLMKHKDVLLRFLTKQNIIAEVVEYNVNSEEKKQKDWFIVPTLLKDHSSKEEMLRFLSGKTQSQVRYSMKFAKSSVVHLVFNKALAAALGTWPVVKFGTKLLLFENVCVLKLIRNHAGLLEQRKDSGTIELKVVHLLSKQIECHPTDVFRRFVESIVLHEFGRLGYPERGRSKPFVPAYRCNHAYHGPGGSSQLTHFKEDEDVICPDNVTHDSFDNIRAKAEWSYENTIDEVYPKMQLTEKTLSKLAQCAIGSNWCLLGPQLKIKKAEIDHIDEEIKQVEMKIYTMLQKWKDRCASNATLDQLVEAIKKCPGVSIYWDEIRNIRDEYLRKQRKQEIDLIRPLSNKIVKIHETLTLECDITKSNVSVTWLKDGEPITPDSRTLISSNGGFHQLVVKDITVNDDAKYTCVYGNCITECFVKVEDTFGPLQFIKELSDIEVGDIPSTVTFLCELNASQTDVEWYYRNQRLYPSNKYTIIDEGSVHILKIKDVSETDEGKYSVLANGLRSEATLYVEETEEERFLLAQHRRQRGMNYSRTIEKCNKLEIRF
ncbi:uncharacterized protein LOC123539700 isoform X2 [Mercenaria mercenaria]|uniref:uncharacterized protein LOC123539700 isoform X2 n=1 Tax=Mercenaria mercenaria TaxID=6596 RepID=UPI00234E8950|nr:uncharacterized protein LOC123539700 isoform X2 [Mercenaria mercenaria]